MLMEDAEVLGFLRGQDERLHGTGSTVAGLLHGFKAAGHRMSREFG